MKDLNVLINGLNMSPQLRAKVTRAYNEATVSRGKRKGKLKAKCPPINTLGAACWQALQANPFKIGFGHLLLMDDENRQVYEWYNTLRQRMELAVETMVKKTNDINK